MRWVFLILSFFLCLLGLEIYHNIEIMDKGYLLQTLEKKKKALEEENSRLQQKLSSFFSLSELESYAREELGLVNPEKVRFLEKKFSP